MVGIRVRDLRRLSFPDRLLFNAGISSFFAVSSIFPPKRRPRRPFLRRCATSILLDVATASFVDFLSPDRLQE